MRALQCAELSEKLAEDMASEGLKGKTLTLKLKETNFEVRTRNATLTHHIHSKEDIFREALKLLRAELPITIRLMVRLLSLLCAEVVLEALKSYQRRRRTPSAMPSSACVTRCPSLSASL